MINLILQNNTILYPLQNLSVDIYFSIFVNNIINILFDKYFN